MECKFHVGQRIVCVDAKERSYPNEIYLSDDRLEIEEGRIYTVRDIGFDEFRPMDAIVRLCEIYRVPAGDETEEPGFMADRFRPLVTRKTDISQLKALLNTQRVRMDA